MLYQGLDVFFPLPQGRDLERDDVDPVIEVFAERVLLYRGLQVLVGGGDEPDVDLAALVAAHGTDDLVFDDPEQFGLERQAHVADLVEEDGAALGFLEDAFLGGDGAGECAAHVAEQLGLKQRLGDGGAVDGYKGHVPAGAVVVDDPGKELFAGPGLAKQKDAAPGIGDLPDLVQDGFERGALADDAAEIVILPDLALEQDVLGLEALLTEGVPDDLLDLLVDDGLHDVVVRAGTEGLDGRVEGRVGGDDDDDLVGVPFPHPGEHLDAVHAGQDDVGQDDVVHAGLEQGKALFRGPGAVDRVPFLDKDALDGLPQRLFVFDDQNVLGHRNLNQ